jgi:hypothetical protein
MCAGYEVRKHSQILTGCEPLHEIDAENDALIGTMALSGNSLEPP